MKYRYWIIVSVMIIAAAVSLGLLWPRTPAVAPTVSETTNVNQLTANRNTSTTTTTVFSTADLPDRDPQFSFTLDIPSSWAVEYVPGSQAVNLFDPKQSGNSSLEKSQIFVKYFIANTFQTLTTVDIRSSTSTTVAGRPAMVYVIAKKSGVPNFTAQPRWRNIEHSVTDVRADDNPTSIFYVFAQAPGLSPTLFLDIIQSLKITAR